MTKNLNIILLLFIVSIFATACSDNSDSHSSPVILSSYIEPVNPNNETTLICKILAKDEDKDMSFIEFAWTDETLSVLQISKITIKSSTGSFSNSLDSSKVEAGARITCEVKITDKKGLSTQVEEHILIQAEPENTPPVFNSNFPNRITLFVGEEITLINLSSYVSDKEDSLGNIKLSISSQSSPSVINFQKLRIKNILFVLIKEILLGQ
jgi:hypothetical protein